MFIYYYPSLLNDYHCNVFSDDAARTAQTIREDCLFGLLVLPVVNMLLPASIPFCHSNNFTCLAIFSTVIFKNFELNAEMQECSKTVFIAVLFIHQ